MKNIYGNNYAALSGRMGILRILNPQGVAVGLSYVRASPCLIACTFPLPKALPLGYPIIWLSAILNFT